MKKLDFGHRFMFIAIALMLINIALDFFNNSLTLISFIGTAAILLLLYLSWPKADKNN